MAMSEYMPSGRSCSSCDATSSEYSMDYAKLGYFYIINNRDFPKFRPEERTRRGTDEDAYRLQHVLTSLGFKVKMHENLTADRMREVMEEAATRDHSQCACFGVAVLSHGSQDGEIYGTNYPIPIHDFVRPIWDCDSLRGKPKIFLFQAGRRDQGDIGRMDRFPEGLQVDCRQNHIPCDKFRIPREPDCVFIFSTPPGCYSWREMMSCSGGSWFIQALCDQLFKVRGTKFDFNAILTRASCQLQQDLLSSSPRPEMDDKLQVPYVVSTLRRELFLVTKDEESTESTESM